MAEWDVSPEEYLTYIQEWIEEYGIDFDTSISNEDMTQEQYEMLLRLDDEKLVWTEHSTCEDNMYTPGFKIFGDCALTGDTASGCGCWQSYAYYIGKTPWTAEYDSVLCTALLPCSVCNPDGEGEGVEGCEGPEVPEGADGGECESGFVNWYFD
jgi:hypothetical protein